MQFSFSCVIGLIGVDNVATHFLSKPGNFAERENVAMACVKVTPQARKHSIRSNLLFGPKLPSWHVTLSTSFSTKQIHLHCCIVHFIFNKTNTFTLLQQQKFCHFFNS